MKPSTPAIKSRGLTWPKLIPGTLLRRYKRFLTDIKLATGDIAAQGIEIPAYDVRAGMQDIELNKHIPRNL